MGGSGLGETGLPCCASGVEKLCLDLDLASSMASRVASTALLMAPRLALMSTAACWSTVTSAMIEPRRRVMGRADALGT